MYNTKDQAFLLRAHVKSLLGATRLLSKEINGRRWQWLEAGNANAAETLVLLHGLSMNKNRWRGVLTELAKNRRVIVPDIPGLNLSVPARDPEAGLEGLAIEISEFISSVVTRPVHLLGHSMAAPLCLSISMRLPLPVQSITMVSLADVQLSQTQSLSLSIASMSQFIRNLTLEQHCDYVASMFYRPPPGTMMIARGSWPEINANKEHIVCLLAAMEQELSHLEQHRDALVMPVLVLNGRQDLWNDITRYSGLFNHPNVSRAELDECRHLPFMEQPMAFVDLVERFLSGELKQGRASA